MTRFAHFALALTLALPAHAQEQQAGAAVDTDAAFQALVDACDDVDALMLRARIRLQIPRTTEAAAAEAQAKMEDGFATCAGGDLEGAKVQLADALKIAEAGVNEALAVEAAADASVSAASSAEPAAESAAAGEAAKPWWKFW